MSFSKEDWFIINATLNDIAKAIRKIEKKRKEVERKKILNTAEPAP